MCKSVKSAVPDSVNFVVSNSMIDPTDKILTLNDIPPGSGAVIVKIRGQSPFKRRLLEMGLVRGSAIRKIKLAPLADPAEFEIKDCHLSLRRAEAADVIVEM